MRREACGGLVSHQHVLLLRDEVIEVLAARVGGHSAVVGGGRVAFLPQRVLDETRRVLCVAEELRVRVRVKVRVRVRMRVRVRVRVRVRLRVRVRVRVRVRLRVRLRLRVSLRLRP